jgi:hypothetical protein
MDGKVSVITPVYNEIKTLKINIRRIQKALRDIPHEIIITTTTARMEAASWPILWRKPTPT